MEQEPTQVTVSIGIQPELLAKVTEAAKEQEQSRSGWIRDAIKRKLRRRTT